MSLWQSNHRLSGGAMCHGVSPDPIHGVSDSVTFVVLMVFASFASNAAKNRGVSPCWQFGAPQKWGCGNCTPPTTLLGVVAPVLLSNC